MLEKIIVTILLMLLSTPGVLASDNIYYYTGDNCNDIIVKENDKLYLKQDWEGIRFELNTIKKLGIRNLKAIDKAEYEAAINEVSYPLNSISLNVYFLDYRSWSYPDAKALSFRDNSVVVFGTYWNMSKNNIHQLAVHELGHHVDFQLMNDEKWTAYKKLRRIEDERIYNNKLKTIHSNRLQEIFAEDFRMLFGGETACAVPHLNKDLCNPSNIKGLKEFFINLVNDIDSQ